MFLGYCCVPFARRKIIASSVLVTFNSIGASFWRDILLISSALGPEDTCIEVAHAWVCVVNLGGMRGGIIISAKLSLIMLLAETFKGSHALTKI